jgi:hypothetical protein
MKYDSARRALAEACRVDDVKAIRDKAHAIAAYARQAKDTEMVTWAMEIKVRAERRTGELLAGMEKQHGALGRPGPGRGHKQKMDSPPDESVSTMKSLGITHNQSSQWQQLAQIPEPEFEKRLAGAAGHVETLTTKHLLHRPTKTRPTQPSVMSHTLLDEDCLSEIKLSLLRVWSELTTTTRRELLSSIRQHLQNLEEGERNA